MRSEHIDTDQILDRCPCGGFAKFICDTERPNPWRADCAECANTTGWMVCQSEAMVAWNRTVRSEWGIPSKG